MASDPPACPRCQQPMEAGYVAAGKGLRFYQRGGLRLTVIGGERLISMWRSRATPAARCAACQVAFVHYGG